MTESTPPKALSTTDLEAQVVYNERQLEDLSKIVYAQGADIELLKKEVEILGRQILQMTEGEAGTV